MKPTRLAIWFGTLLVLALLSRWQTSGARAGSCRLDGNRIAPLYQVDLLADGRILASFCCVRCAVEWPDVPSVAYWQVRDEITGEVLDSTRACFVESSVVTVPARRDRTHAFGNWADAMSHVETFGGERIANPLLAPPSHPAAENDQSKDSE